MGMENRFVLVIPEALQKAFITFQVQYLQRLNQPVVPLVPKSIVTHPSYGKMLIYQSEWIPSGYINFIEQYARRHVDEREDCFYFVEHEYSYNYWGSYELAAELGISWNLEIFIPESDE